MKLPRLRIPLLRYLIKTLKSYKSHHTPNDDGPRPYRKLEHSTPTLEGNGSFYIAITNKKRSKRLEIDLQYKKLNENTGRNSYRDLQERKRTV